MHFKIQIISIIAAAFGLTLAVSAQELPQIELNGVKETHVMIPMRDGKRLSAYIYLPAGEGKWPAVFEQRYASVAGNSSRKIQPTSRSMGSLLRW